MPHENFQIYTLKINTIIWHCKKNSAYFWTRVYTSTCRVPSGLAAMHKGSYNRRKFISFTDDSQFLALANCQPQGLCMETVKTFAINPSCFPPEVNNSIGNRWGGNSGWTFTRLRLSRVSSEEDCLSTFRKETTYLRYSHRRYSHRWSMSYILFDQHLHGPVTKTKILVMYHLVTFFSFDHVTFILFYFFFEGSVWTHYALLFNWGLLTISKMFLIFPAFSLLSCIFIASWISK